MSDRPMRLKYLTKMKIILCIFLLYITAVSVFGQLVELNGIVGESVKFPAAVKIEGILQYSTLTIGEVKSGRFTPPRNGGYRGRVQWDSSTGLLSLSALRLEDSGEYTVQDTYQNINTVFQLNVYIPVSKPHVSITHNEYPCTIECTAERGTEATLSWYREGEEMPYVSSRVASVPYLHLPQTVETSGTYTCVAKNSVSNETASITVGAHCTAPSGFSTMTIVLSLLVFVVAIIAGLICRLYPHIKSKHLDDDEQTLSPQDEDKQTSPQGIRRIIPGIRRIIPGIRSKHPVREAPKTMTSSHPTEVPLNQATPEVGDELEIEKGDPTQL